MKRPRRAAMPLVLALLPAAAVCAACTSGGAPPVLTAYDLPDGKEAFRLSVEVGGSVDVGGPQDAAALTQLVPNGDLRVKGAMRLEYDQTVRSGPEGELELEATATSLQGRVDSFLSTRILGEDDLASIGESGVVRLEMDRDGVARDSSGSPLGEFDLPVLRDVLTIWPCPQLPEGGVAPGAEWTTETPVGKAGRHITSRNRYTPVEVEGTRYLDLDAVREGTIDAGDTDLDQLLAVLTGEEPAGTLLGTAGVSARIRLEERCRFDADDLELDSWTTRGTVEVALSSGGGGRYDAVLDGTTVNLELLATSERLPRARE